MATEIPGTLFLKRTLLLVEWPDGSQQKLPIVQDVTRVGRGSDGNELAVPQEFKSISRRHFEIRRQGIEYRLHDLGSGNGVLLNGQSVANATLKDGDEIRIGMAESGQELRILFYAGSELQAQVVAPESVVAAAYDKLSFEPPSGCAYLRVRLPAGDVRFFALEQDFTVIGRDERADLTLAYPFISARHFELRRVGAAFTITELGSVNGTLVNNQTLGALIATPIHDRAIIRLGDESFGVSLSLTFCNPLEPAAPLEGLSLSAAPVPMVPSRAMLIGRADECDIHLGAPEVSRRHASIRRQGVTWVLEDLGSVNGTFVNEQRIKSIEIQDGYLIRIGTYVLLFQNGQLSPYQSTGMRLDVGGLSFDRQNRSGDQRSPDDISFSVLPREFVVILAGGSDRRALLDALMGARPGSGQVRLNGYDFYLDHERYRSQLGYVPQADILHLSLRVETALDYAAQLRLPPNVSAAERKLRIGKVLETVQMNTESLRQARIGDLSVGQRKRVSIAAELLADPRLIYLDEACAGLDPGMEKKLVHTLRRMADEGRTVILISQASGNMIQADQVAFLSEGKLIYFGPPQQALDFFDVNDFADLYEKIESGGEAWRKMYQQGQPEYYQKYVLERQAAAQAMPRPALPKQHFGLDDMLRQFMVLVQRALSVLFASPSNLALLVLLPLLALLQLATGSRDVLTGNLAILADPLAAAKTMLESYLPYDRTNAFVFMMSFEAVLAGLFVSSGELLQDRPVYLREKMLNLRVLPYVLSKAFLYIVFAYFQVGLYLLILWVGLDYPKMGLYLPGGLEIFVTLFLTMLAGISLGLVISALSRSAGMLNYLLALVLFFQFFLAGAIVDLRGSPLEPLSYLSVTRWSLTGLGVSIDLPRLVDGTILCEPDPGSPAKTVCSSFAGAAAELHLDYDQSLLLKSWLVLASMTGLGLAATGVCLERLHQE